VARQHFTKEGWAWELQDIATLDETPPTLSQWYTLLPTTYGVQVRYIAVFQENDETDSKDVDLRATYDGKSILHENNGVLDSSWEYEYLDWVLGDSTTRKFASGGQRLAGGPPSASEQGDVFYARSLKLEYRIVTALGTNQELRARCSYYKKVRC
jgi:hypothetical protein